MKHLILNADDFGYSYGVNYGIIESHLRGVLTSTTLMAGMPGFDHAVISGQGASFLGCRCAPDLDLWPSGTDRPQNPHRTQR